MRKFCIEIFTSQFNDGEGENDIELQDVKFLVKLKN
jgi:hypothetical protein